MVDCAIACNPDNGVCNLGCGNELDATFGVCEVDLDCEPGCISAIDDIRCGETNEDDSEDCVEECGDQIDPHVGLCNSDLDCTFIDEFAEGIFEAFKPLFILCGVIVLLSIIIPICIGFLCGCAICKTIVDGDNKRANYVAQQQQQQQVYVQPQQQVVQGYAQPQYK